MDCKEACVYIHEYLDGMMDAERKAQLGRHLAECSACSARLKALEKTEALVAGLRPVSCPDGMTERILQHIPEPRRPLGWVRWMRRHPGFSVAVVFVLIMAVAVLSQWNQGTMLVVKGNDLDGINISGNEVTVPEGVTVDGDLLVENGTLRVEGVVQGNVVVIDGTLQASTANISGKITKVNQAIDWVWYKIGEWLEILAR